MLLNRIRNAARYSFLGIGISTILLLAAGTIADVLAIDPTSGGYEAPYTDFSGEPLDWDETYLTDTGMYTPGYVIDTHVDCTTGMINFDIFGLQFDYRQLSPRALVVHEPREACVERGFDPQF
jgi:hypothetical protein